MTHPPPHTGIAEGMLENEDCANLFGQGKDRNGNRVTAGQVLFDLFNGLTYGSVSVGDISSASGTTTSATTTPGVINYGGGYMQNAAYIQFNDLAGVFVTGNAIDQAIAVLHELGHAMNDIFGTGTSVIQQDGKSVPNGVQLSMDNTSLIETTCFTNGLPPPTLLQ